MSGCVALIVAAGRGHRFGGDMPKQYCELNGKSVLRRTIEAFASHPGVTAVQVVIHPDDRELYNAATIGLDLAAPVHGGETRQDSVRLGLQSLEADAPDHVLIHDAARPFLSMQTISNVINGLAEHHGAIPAQPVNDTLKREGKDGIIAETVDRSGLWRAQTPQGFRFINILQAHKDCAGQDLTDDAAVAERAGLSVALVQGSEENVKITSREDLNQATRSQDTETRTGMGFDVHRFASDGDFVTLCGLQIPCEFGLEGHSDADVALHALTDAILGTIGAGDIGSHFPPSDSRWKGAPSSMFIEHAARQVADRGGRILHVDITIICELPKVGPHRDQMVERIADMLEIEKSRVSVKATTTEGLGFTGRGEGIAAQAIATIAI